MATRTTRKKAGLPPGTLIHIGEQRVATTRLSLIEYSQASLNQQELKNLSDWRPASPGSMLEASIRSVSSNKLAPISTFTRLSLKIIVNSEQRQKVDDYDEYLYVALKMLYPHGDDGEIMAEQVSIVLGRLLTFQENGKDCFDGIRTRLKTDKGKIRKCGADYLIRAGRRHR